MPCSGPSTWVCGVRRQGSASCWRASCRGAPSCKIGNVVHVEHYAAFFVHTVMYVSHGKSMVEHELRALTFAASAWESGTHAASYLRACRGRLRLPFSSGIFVRRRFLREV